MIVAEPGFAGAAGVARREITPQPGVPARAWGPATDEFASGVHRPMTLTAIAFAAGSDAPLVLIAADLGWWKSPGDEPYVRRGVLEAIGLYPARVLINLSHTHAGPSATLVDGHGPSTAYLELVRGSAVDAAREAISRLAPATLTTAVGRCYLAANRDLRRGDRYVVGFNPEVAADDTLILGRLAGGDGKLLAVLANYACHPTTLAWQNTLTSPDFVGAAREVVETATGGVPFVFLQGASGELAPRHQYVGDVAVADRHGRSLGYAALSALEGMPPPGSALAFDGVVESGAALGMWQPKPHRPSAALAAASLDVELELREAVTLEELERRWAGIDPNSLAERLRRAQRVNAFYGGLATFPFPVWAWRLGDCAFVGVAGEPYSQLQIELRARRPDRRIFVLGVTNAEMSAYLPNEEAYDRNVYQAWQTPYVRGSLERVIDALDDAVGRLFGANAAG